MQIKQNLTYINGYKKKEIISYMYPHVQEIFSIFDQQLSTLSYTVYTHRISNIKFITFRSVMLNIHI